MNFVDWISVRDSLPKEAGHYLVTVTMNGADIVRIARWKPRDRIWVFSSALQEFPPSHWSEVPLGPNEMQRRLSAKSASGICDAS
jgi:hypothetical protein